MGNFLDNDSSEDEIEKLTKQVEILTNESRQKEKSFGERILLIQQIEDNEELLKEFYIEYRAHKNKYGKKYVPLLKKYKELAEDAQTKQQFDDMLLLFDNFLGLQDKVYEKQIICLENWTDEDCGNLLEEWEQLSEEEAIFFKKISKVLNEEFTAESVIEKIFMKN